MIDIAKIKIGDKVYYQPEHYKSKHIINIDIKESKDIEKWENGIVKEVHTHSIDSVRVVYNCDGDCENFKNYTSSLTNIRDLYEGWKY